MEKRLSRLTWITVIAVLLFALWIKYQLSVTGNGECDLYKKTYNETIQQQSDL